ncbi:MAG: glutamine synthetase beta-grasp domain-containing protein [Synergistaceae bacterium]|jgi:glutamine synthetase|nr:glutamine synthetase beta-grasp domain-containing protein [Synergistaceae bacterium]
METRDAEFGAVGEMVLEKYLGDGAFDFLNLIALDLNGSLRSVTLPKSYATKELFKKGIGFDASNYGYAKVTESDMIIVPDEETAFIEKRGGFRILHALGDVRTASGDLFDQYPRNIVKKTRGFLREKNIADDMRALVELEFYIFNSVEYGCDVTGSFYSVGSAEGLGHGFDTNPRFAPHQGYHRLPPDDRYMDFRNRTVSLMEEIGIPVKYHHHEVGASQLEIELNFMNIQKAADNVCLAKWIIRSVADKMGLKVTFMPKPLYKMAGSGMHVHQFLEKSGASIFIGDELYGLSRQGLSYIAGLLEHSLTGSLLAFTNPSTNSYRRLISGYEAPVSASFAKASRNAAVRIPGYLGKKEVRMEYRTGDASANVHYMLAAMTLAGCDGILRGRDPVALKFGDASSGGAGKFPLNLHAVMDGLEKDHQYLEPVFPKELFDLWISAKRAEADYVYNAPAPQEYELYF